MAIQWKMPELLGRLLESPRLGAMFRPDYPPYALEISARRLVAVALDRTGGRARLAAERVVDLPEGLVVPSLLRPIVQDVKSFAGHVHRALDDLPGYEGRCALVLPDQIAKITFVELERGGRRHAETEELIRWKLKRATPFRIEDARIAFQMLPSSGDDLRCLVSLVNIQLLEQLEELLVGLGCEAGLVDLTSFNLWNLIAADLRPDEDVLLLNADDGHVTAIVARGGAPLFLRCKAPAAMARMTVDAVCAELHPTILYYQDRLGGEQLGRAIVRGPQEVVEQLAETLDERWKIPCEPLRVNGVAGLDEFDRDRIDRLAPAIGAALGR